ncbi:MAG: AAA family ATPase [Eubacteriales bacterium]|nr:AAA family ATPase [Eubacteriales bacterium]
MIDRLEIHDFKSIRELKLDLGRVNIFLGANGAGKSNLLEALGVVSAASYGSVDDESLLRRGVRPGVPRLYKTSNRYYQRAQQISFSVNGYECEYRISLLNPLDSPRPQWDYKTETFRDHDGKILSTTGVRSAKNKAFGGMPALNRELDINTGEYRFLEELRSYAIYNPNSPMLRGTEGDPQTRTPVGLSGGGLADGILDLLQKARNDDDLQEYIDDLLSMFDWVRSANSELNISSILAKSVSRPKRVITFIDRYMKENSNKLTAYDASEGVLYALFLMVLCLSENGPRVFAVDNIDQALNPRIVRNLVIHLHTWFAEMLTDKQILCTAHNPAILDGIDFSDDLIHLFTVDRDSKGLSRVSRVMITDAVQKKAREKGISMSQLWMEGYFGGVPNV